MRILLTLFVTLIIGSTAIAQQPRSQTAIDAFEKSAETIQVMSELTNDGFGNAKTAAVVVDGDINDEGLDALYLVSTYFEKGDKPFNKQAKMLLGLVYISGGYVKNVKLVDSEKAANALASAAK